MAAYQLRIKVRGLMSARVRTWALKGQTPVIQFHFNWKHVSAIAGLARTTFMFRLHDGAIKSAQVVEFLKALRRQLRKRLPQSSLSW